MALGSDIWAKWSAILILGFNFIEHSQDAYFSKRVFVPEYHPMLGINLDAFTLGLRLAEPLKSATPTINRHDEELTGSSSQGADIPF